MERRIGEGPRFLETALRAQIHLGGEEFEERMQALAEPAKVREIPCAQGQVMRLPLKSYPGGNDKNHAIARACRGHTPTAIAAATGLSVWRVSRLIAANEARGKT